MHPLRSPVMCAGLARRGPAEHPTRACGPGLCSECQPCRDLHLGGVVEVTVVAHWYLLKGCDIIGKIGWLIVFILFFFYMRVPCE